MPNLFSSEVNDILVDIYSTILRVEEEMLKSVNRDLGISELHILETVGRKGKKGCSISEIAQSQKVTLPTVTVAIKKLEKKQYVKKIRSADDARVVNVALTREGRRADAAHRYFHEQMVRSLLQDIKEEERPMIFNALKNLDAFLRRTAHDVMGQQSAKEQ